MLRIITRLGWAEISDDEEQYEEGAANAFSQEQEPAPSAPKEPNPEEVEEQDQGHRERFV